MKSNENFDEFDESNMFADDDIVTLEKEGNEVGKILKRLFNGEPKNINPLTEIPEPKMRLYGFSGAFNSAFFDSKEELKEWLKTNKTNNFGNVCVLDYLGRVAGRSDVIRITMKGEDPKLYTAVDEDGYGTYNAERSTYRGEFFWEYDYGDLSDEYAAFRDRGIVFENDIYKKIEERNKRILALAEETNKEGLTRTRKNDTQR